MQQQNVLQNMMEFFDDNQLRFPEAVLLFCRSGVGLLIWMNCRITFVF